jgi:hypothetical protein
LGEAVCAQGWIVWTPAHPIMQIDASGRSLNHAGVNHWGTVTVVWRRSNMAAIRWLDTSGAVSGQCQLCVQSARWSWLIESQRLYFVGASI